MKNNEAFSAVAGKTIKAANLTDEDQLILVFEDYSTLIIWDDGQSCCESRYMRTDDNLDDLVGCQLLGLEVKEAPSIEDEYGEHEVQFLEIKTNKGCVTMASHNEHNGYYGGFAIELRYQPAGEKK